MAIQESEGKEKIMVDVALSIVNPIMGGKVGHLKGGPTLPPKVTPLRSSVNSPLHLASTLKERDARN